MARTRTASGAQPDARDRPRLTDSTDCRAFSRGNALVEGTVQLGETRGGFAEGGESALFVALRPALVDVDFFSGPKPTGRYYEPSESLRADKHEFGASRRARWFGRTG